MYNGCECVRERWKGKERETVKDERREETDDIKLLYTYIIHCISIHLLEILMGIYK